MPLTSNEVVDEQLTQLLKGTNYIWSYLAKLHSSVRDRALGPFYRILGQTHVNGWSRVIAS